jgi:hypothetical protein
METSIADTSGRGVGEDDGLLIDEDGWGSEGLKEGGEFGWCISFGCFML